MIQRSEIYNPKFPSSTFNKATSTSKTIPGGTSILSVHQQIVAAHLQINSLQDELNKNTLDSEALLEL